MNNPFRYGDVATGEFFTNRLTELDELVADVRSGQNVVVISPRRYGKTSLVFRAIERLKAERVLVAYVDLFRTPTRERLAGHLAAAIYSGLVSPVERAWQQAIGAFQRLPLRPRITINPDGSPSFEFTAGEDTRDIERTIEGLLELPGQIAAERKRRVVLILDEFQEVVSLDPHLPALMRSIFQFQTEVAHVFLGSKRHLMQRVFTDANQPLYRSARPLLLGPISAEDFATFIVDRFGATGLQIADEAVAAILSITEGHPHDTQELCFFAWGIAYGEQSVATPALVERALGRVLEAENAHYTTLWESLTPNQRAVMAALTESGEAIFSESYRRRHQLGSASSVQRALESLLERELVEAAPPRRYRVPDAFLRAWIARLGRANGP